MKIARNNCEELEKVSNNYKNNSLKLKATKFLITNMMGSFSKNGEIVKICTPFYEEYDSLANLYESLVRIQDKKTFSKKEIYQNQVKKNI